MLELLVLGPRHGNRASYLTNCNFILSEDGNLYWLVRIFLVSTSEVIHFIRPFHPPEREFTVSERTLFCLFVYDFLVLPLKTCPFLQPCGHLPMCQMGWFSIQKLFNKANQIFKMYLFEFLLFDIGNKITCFSYLSNFLIFMK